jgi:hypothetical protein
MIYLRVIIIIIVIINFEMSYSLTPRPTPRPTTPSPILPGDGNQPLLSSVHLPPDWGEAAGGWVAESPKKAPWQFDQTR